MTSVEQIVVEVLDRQFSLEELRLEDLPPEIFQWELGGIPDVLGQLAGWLWSETGRGLNYLQTQVTTKLWAARDYLWGVVIGVGEYIWEKLKIVRDWLWDKINPVLKAIQKWWGENIDPALKDLGKWWKDNVEPAIANIEKWYKQNIEPALTDISKWWKDKIEPAFKEVEKWVNKGVELILSPVLKVLGSITTSLIGIGKSLSDVSGLISTITSAVVSGFSTITSTLVGFGSFFASLGSQVSSLASTITSAVSNFSSAVSSAVGNISSVASQVMSSMINLSTTLTSQLGNFASTFASSFTQIYTYLSSFGQTIIDLLPDLRDWILGGFQTIATTLGQIGISISDIFHELPVIVQDIYGWIVGGINDLGNKISTWWGDVQAYFTNQYNNLLVGTNDVIRSLTGFINPLINIGNILQKLFADNWKTLTDGLYNTLKPFIMPWQVAIDGLTAFLKDPWGGLIKVLGLAFKPFLGLIGGLALDKLVDALTGLTKSIGVFGLSTDWFTDTMNFVQSDILKNIWRDISLPMISLGYTILADLPVIYNIIKPAIVNTLSWGYNTLADLIKWVDTNTKSIQQEAGKFIGQYLISPFLTLAKEASSQMDTLTGPDPLDSAKVMMNIGGIVAGSVFAPYIVSNLLMSLGDFVKINIDAKLLSAGLGINLDPAALLKHVARVIWNIPDIILSSLGYGLGIWVAQPIAKAMNAGFRNDIPIEMPTIEEIRRMANRASVSTEFKTIMNKMRKFMMYYGYSDYVIEWNLGISTLATATTPAYLSTSVKDRFDKSVEIPLDLRHALPSGSDLCRMMVRDVFGPPEDPFGSFSNFMSVQGYNEDVAKMYYLLHFRYPTLETLYNFLSRCAVGFAWVTETPNEEAGLGASGAVAPASLNANITNVESLVTFLNKHISENLKLYSKWWDYAPFSWIKGFTSDRLLQLDMMADIPMRIDARWMYKWSVIDDIDLFKVVVSRGMHPKWIEKIAVAEAMNALAEERTYARTGILNAFERGFTTRGMAEKKLGSIVSVKILGKDYPVKMLDGETKLLMVRSDYDRALNVLNRMWSNLTTAFQRNIIDRVMAVDIIQTAVGRFKQLLGIDLEADNAFLTAWVDTIEIRQTVETVQRIRYWMRIFIYRASQLAESGESFEGLLDEYGAAAFLTPQEVIMMKRLGSAFIEVAKKNKKLSIVQRLVKGKIKSGAWSVEQGLAELVKAGMDRGDAQAFIEAEVKTRAVSVDKLISMSERIPIDPDVLKRKMDAEGVPLDEQAMYIPYAVATEIEEEQGRLVTEYIEDFVSGGINQATFINKLNSVATLDGTVQAKFSIPWINYSPEERTILTQLASMRRARRITPAEKLKTVSSDKLISLMENIPIPLETLKAKMDSENMPLDEQQMYIQNAVASEVSEEIGKIATELVTDFANGKITEAQLRAGLNDVATLGGSVPTILKIPWIVLSPQERSLLVALAKLRKARLGK